MKRLLALSLAFSLLGASQAATANEEIEVKTRNIYLGANLDPIIAAPPAEIPIAVAVAFGEVVATDFPLRAQALANEIAKERPHLIGVQEVTLYRCQFVGDSIIGGTAPATDPCAFPGATLPGTGDYLQDLLTAVNTHPKLLKKGITYVAAASVQNADIEVPMFNPFSPPIIPDLPPTTDVRYTDHDVILARSDVFTSQLIGAFSICGVPVPNPFPFGPPMLTSTASMEGCNYTVNAPTPFGIPILRGFVGVNATVEGKQVRFVSTHLEVQEPEAGNPASAIFQSVQAAELIGTMLATSPLDRKLIVVGDINSSPVDAAASPIAPYGQFVGTGFVDIWTATDDDDVEPGFTCCQADDLSNPTSLLDERVDIIFVDDPLEEVEAKVVGRKPSFEVPPFWAADHAGVVAEIEFDEDDED